MARRKEVEAEAVDTVEEDKLSAEEQAYFETRGEAEKPEDPAAEPTQEGQDDADKAAVESKAENAEPQGDKSDKPDDENRKVNYQALREERERRQRVEAQLQNLDARYQHEMRLVNQRLAMLQQPQQQVQEPQVPNPDEDIFGATKWTVERVQQWEREQQEAKRQAEETARTQQQQQQLYRQVADQSRRAYEEFMQEEPDYPEAYQYVKNQRYNEMRVDGLSHEDAVQRVQMEEFQFAASHVTQGRNPARQMMEIAKVRGWQPKKAAPAAPPPQDRLATVAEGQKANQSLSSVGASGTARGKIDANALAKMSEDDFEAWLETNGSKGFKRIVAG